MLKVVGVGASKVASSMVKAGGGNVTGAAGFEAGVDLRGGVLKLTGGGMARLLLLLLRGGVLGVLLLLPVFIFEKL